MKKLYIGTILCVAILIIISKWNENTLKKNGLMNEEKVVKETMSTSFYVDPTINLSSDKITSIIIEFKTKPAAVAVKEAEAEGKQLSLEEATKHVEESHQKFQEELNTFLDDYQVPYTIRHTYKTALNGVSMELPAKDIKRLSQSTVIEKIYPNRKIHLSPPITPYRTM